MNESVDAISFQFVVLLVTEQLVLKENIVYWVLVELKSTKFLVLCRSSLINEFVNFFVYWIFEQRESANWVLCY